jgi:hypothetical protein
MTCKVVYSGCFDPIAYPFDRMGERVEVARDARQMTEPDSMLVIWGGADIHPDFYNHPKSVTTYPGGKRDVLEFELMRKAVAMGIPIMGVCRGAQALCALAGGFLLQDVRGHAGHEHRITTFDGRKMWVNSLHHQMLAGYEDIGELLAWSEINRSEGRYIYRDDQVFVPPEGWKEPEMVYFPKVKGLAVQWHPEMLDDQEESTKFIFEMWEKKFGRIEEPALDS